MVGTQYSAFSPLDSVYVNGKLTMGENLADFGGLTLAYSALAEELNSSTARARAQAIDGFTPEQRFFLAWAQVWRTNARPEYLRQQVITDPHSPGPVPHHRPAHEHARVLRGLRLQGGRTR